MEWIKCTDRLPDIVGQGYLVSYPKTDSFESWTWVDYWIGTFWSRSEEGRNPSHWAELPKPPEKEEK